MVCNLAQNGSKGVYDIRTYVLVTAMFPPTYS